MGRILVKGFVSVSYFPTFLSKACLCYCLFVNPVPDSMFVDSFTKYLYPVEEEFIVDIIRNNQFPDDEDEFTDFLERFKSLEGWLPLKTLAKSFLKFPSRN